MSKLKAIYSKYEIFFLLLIFFAAIWVLMYSAFLAAAQYEHKADLLTEERIAHYELHKEEFDCYNYLGEVVEE